MTVTINKIQQHLSDVGCLQLEERHRLVLGSQANNLVNFQFVANLSKVCDD
jgi:hypothetical protein